MNILPAGATLPGLKSIFNSNSMIDSVPSIRWRITLNTLHQCDRCLSSLSPWPVFDCASFSVCFAVWKNRHMRTVTNYFIVNLSFADVLVTIICLPASLVVDITETWFFGNTLCKVVPYLQVRGQRWHLIYYKRLIKSLWIQATCFSMISTFFISCTYGSKTYIFHISWDVQCETLDITPLWLIALGNNSIWQHHPHYTNTSTWRKPKTYTILHESLILYKEQIHLYSIHTLYLYQSEWKFPHTLLLMLLNSWSIADLYGHIDPVCYCVLCYTVTAAAATVFIKVTCCCFY